MLANSHLAEDVIWTPVTTGSRSVVGVVSESVGSPTTVRALVARKVPSTESSGESGSESFEELVLYIPTPAVVPGPLDRFEVRGNVYQVFGPSHRWAKKGTEVHIRRGAPK